MIDVAKTQYEIIIILKDGETVRFNSSNRLLTDASWGDDASGIAAKATIEIPQVKYKNGWLSEYVALMCPVQILANGIPVFNGTVWEWGYTSSNSDRATSIVCYDKLKYAMNSDDVGYWSAGKSTKDIISDTCVKNGLELDYKWGSITHEKVLYNGAKVAEMITDTIKEAEKQLGKTAVVRFENNKLAVLYKGSNKDVYVFRGSENVMRTKDKFTMNNLITKVMIIGKENDNGLSPIEATIDGDLSYGTLAEIIKKNGDTTIEKAREEAQKIIDEKGKPERLISPVECVDVPFIRKGDKVQMSAGNLLGYYYVKAVTHNITKRTMTMDLEEVTSANATADTQVSLSTGGIQPKVGDVVQFIGGNHYISSTANSPTGGNRTAGQAKCTIIAKGAKHPYHLIGGAYTSVDGNSNVYGWVDADTVSAIL